MISNKKPWNWLRPFTVRPQQKQVYAAVENWMTGDNNVTTWENTLLMELRRKFRL
jgi:hypothetical protein